MSEEPLQPVQKKSIWDILDTYLPSATAAYGKIREQKTGVNPFGVPPPNDDGLDTFDKKDEMNYDNPYFPDDKKKSKTLFYVLGGVALIGLGIGTYFIIKKNKKS